MTEQCRCVNENHPDGRCMNQANRHRFCGPCQSEGAVEGGHMKGQHMDDLMERFNATTARYEQQRAIRDEMDRIAQPWMDAVLAAESAGLRVKTVRMPSATLRRLEDAIKQLAAANGEPVPQYGAMTLYGVRIVEAPV